MASYKLVNNETGEIENEYFQINTLEDTQRKKKFTDKKKSENKFNQNVDKYLGTFYFLFYKLINKGIPKQYIIRFLYLCAYMDYENKLLFGNQKDDGRYMVEKDLQEVLKLSRRETFRVRDILVENKLIIMNENNKITINEKYCLKGKLKSSNKKKIKTRIFENGIKELYEKAKSKEHKKLYLLIELLPYINIKENIICKNPKCETMKEIQPLNLKEVCKIIKYSPKQSSRLKKELLNLTINDKYVFKFNEIGKSQYIEVNPSVYYKGGEKQYTGLKRLISEFELN